MDACLKKEQIGTHYVWMGALEGGFGGGGGLRGVHPKSIRTKKTPSCLCNDFAMLAGGETRRMLRLSR